MRRIASLLLLLALLGGCGAGHGGEVPGEPQAKFTLRMLPDTYLDGGTASGFRMVFLPNNDGVLMTLQAQDAVALKACAFELTYDSAHYTPLHAESMTHFDPEHGEYLQSVDLAQLTTPGKLTFATTLAGWDKQPGLSGNQWMAKVQFARHAFEANSESKVASTAVSACPTYPCSRGSFARRTMTTQITQR